MIDEDRKVYISPHVMARGCLRWSQSFTKIVSEYGCVENSLHVGQLTGMVLSSLRGKARRRLGKGPWGTEERGSRVIETAVNRHLRGQPNGLRSAHRVGQTGTQMESCLWSTPQATPQDDLLHLKK